MPDFIRSTYSRFPIYYTPAIPPPSTVPSSTPVLWIIPPNQANSKILSRDVECLKWQAYIALRGMASIKVRWDIDPAGGVDGRLPCLWIPPLTQDEKDSVSGLSRGEVLSARMIPGWADITEGEHVWNTDLEGYIDEQAKDESRAWVALLEGAVHAALLSYRPPPPIVSSWLHGKLSPLSQLSAILHPPPAPLTGLSTLVPPHGINVPTSTLHQRYQEAIGSLSDRLGTDKWFLGSSGPTPLDALIFAYLHIALHPDVKGLERARAEVTHRVNLVAWERKVRALVSGAFKPLHHER
ncbi:hypothetical protein BU17DRAFT_55694 [Hysterangium stoloniferum]|nr:hypothetical protein BU17DRAFT_55694 [Hysterangium stoloniferum]